MLGYITAPENTLDASSATLTLEGYMECSGAVIHQCSCSIKKWFLFIPSTCVSKSESSNNAFIYLWIFLRHLVTGGISKRFFLMIA